MANYDRKILVPYLEDVSCVEIMYHKVATQCQQTEQEYRRYKNYANMKFRKPEYPLKEEPITTINPSIVIVIGLSAILLIIGIICNAAKGPRGMGDFLSIIGGIGIFVGGVGFVCEYNKAQRTVEENYYSEIEQYKIDLKNYEQNTKNTQSYYEYAHKLKLELNEILSHKRELEELKKKMYAPNVIPVQYRTLDSVCYLYDFFRTSRETDLEKVIQIMILDNINQKILNIINKLDQIIINQKIQISQQSALYKEIQEQRTEEMKAIAKAEQDTVKQLEYLSMIEANTAADAYFSLATYYAVS